MNENIIVLCVIYFTISGFVGGFVLPTSYSDRFYRYYEMPSIVEVIFLLLLGFLLGWLMFPIFMFKGLINVICRIIKRVKRERD